MSNYQSQKTQNAYKMSQNAYKWLKCNICKIYILYVL